jgi:hypothetical protein
MAFTILLALSGLTLSSVAIYYSVMGLTAIFAAAYWPTVVMGTTLEVSKLVAASWLKAHWKRIPFLMKLYMTTAVLILMVITSMGIFGYLSKAHSDQSLISGDVQSKIAIYDEKIKTAKENIEANRKQLKQMDEAVDQVMARSTDEKGADKSNAIRRSQQRDRSALAKDIEANQKIIAALNDESAPIRAEVRKVEAEVGPIKYIAALIYGDNPDANILEKAVTWVIMVIVSVFDPLAVLMLLASQMTWMWYKKEGEEVVETPVQTEEPPTPEPTVEPSNDPKYEQDDGPLTDDQINQLKTLTANEVTWPFPSYEEITPKEQTNANDDINSSTTVDNSQRDDDGDGEPVAVLEPVVDEPAAEDNAALLMQERLARGESYISGEGVETVVVADFPENPFRGQQFKDEATDENYIFNGTSWVYSPLNTEDDDSKKKSYMIKDQNLQIKKTLK